MSDDFDIRLLYVALDQKREAQGLTWTGVAKEIERRFTKVSASTIKGIRDKHFVEGDGGLQMLLWLGSSPESFAPGLKAGREHELKEPKNAVLRFDVKETYRLLDVKRISANLTWDQVAKQIGHVPPGMLQRFKKGGRTSFPAIVRISQWLDVPTKDLTKESSW